MAEPILHLVTSSLVGDTFGGGALSGITSVLGLTAITWSVVLPLTLYKKLYGIGVAYGFSVAAGGLALLQVLPPSGAAAGPAVLLTQASIFYGVRLSLYLLLRQATRKGSAPTIENGSLVGRVLFSFSLALFYAFLITPMLYAMRGASPLSSLVQAGALLAWGGAGLEAVADLHKFWVKQGRSSIDQDTKKTFVGPTGGVYRISRHPNYLGEILFWTGIFVGGIPSVFGEGFTPVVWTASIMGWFGILTIMTKATERLEGRQAETYKGQLQYDQWTKKVPYPLFPLVK